MAEGKKGNEVKIGILALTSILALFLGFNFFKGNGLFSRSKEFVSIFDNVEGVSPSSKVLLNGYKIGKVNAVEMTADHKFKVILQLEHDIKIPKGSGLEAVGSDLLSGAKNLNLIASNSTKDAVEGDTLMNTAAMGLMDGIKEGVPDVMNKLTSVGANADTLMRNLRGVVTDNTSKHIEQILVSVELAMKQIEVLSKTLAKQTGNINSLMQNANNTMGNFNKLSNGLANDGKVDQILNNAKTATDQLAQAKIETTINNLESATQKLNAVLAKLDNKDGTLGLLMNDTKLYNSLNQTVNDLGNLSQDLKDHPAKYINISVLPGKSRSN